MWCNIAGYLIHGISRYHIGLETRERTYRDAASLSRIVDNAHTLLFCQNLLFICFRDPEPQILDYRTQQYKIFPYLAASFAVRFAGIQLWNMYTDVVSELAGGDLEKLPEVKCFICLCTYCTEINIHLLLLALVWVFAQYHSGVCWWCSEETCCLKVQVHTYYRENVLSLYMQAVCWALRIERKN